MKSCYVVDECGDIPEKNALIFDWNRYERNDEYISVPLYLESNSDSIRARLIALLGELGTVNIGRKTILERLQTSQGFSLWWMSLPEEKSVQKSPHLFDCLRLLALEELFKVSRPEIVRFVSENKVVAEALKELCREMKVQFIWLRSSATSSPQKKIGWARRLHIMLPRSLQGLIWLIRHVAMRWRLRLARSQFSEMASADISIFSYFIHLNKENCSKGTFSSRHWGEVANLINSSSNNGANWFHHYLESPEMPDKNTGLRWLASFNKASRLQGKHVFMDSFLNVGLIFQTVHKFLKLIPCVWLVKKMPRAIEGRKLPSWLWPLIQNDVKESIYGRTALRNLLWYGLFDSALGSLPRQRLGFYLNENQDWERAMVHCWRRHGHGELVAVAHSTVRYWDLRYFYDPRYFCDASPLALPLPDKLAVNGPAPFRTLVAAGYPVDQLVEVEAQRYLELKNVNVLRSDRRSATFAIAQRNLHKKIRLLVLGDISKKSTADMMSLMQLCAAELNEQFDVVVKPHPGCPIYKNDFSNLRYQITHESLINIYADFEVALAANSTSAALDMLLGSVRVVVHLTPGEINLSPVRSLPGVAFVSTAKELIKALCDSDYANSIVEKYDYFWLDPLLPRWRALIEQLGKSIPSNIEFGKESFGA